jgi:hypothetical protein
LANNNLGALVLPRGWEEDDGFFYGPDGEEQDDPPPGSSPGIIAIANAISDMGAMMKLDMSRNKFKGAAAGKSIGGMLTGNSTLKDLNLSKCNIDSDAAQGISTGLAGNGAMTSLNLSSNKLGVKGATIIGEAIKVIRNKVCHRGRFGTFLMSI